MPTDVQLPALGESITEGTLAQWLKKPGESVAADEPIASIETDKVSVEVPSPIAGVLSETLVNEGDTVAVGAVIARIGEGGAAVAPASPAQAAANATTNPAGAGETPQLRGTEHAPEAPAAGEAPSPDGRERSDVNLTMSPAVRRAVLEHHVDPSQIKGTGKDGRLTKDDVIAAATAKSAAPAAPAEAKAPSAPAPAPAAQSSAPATGGARTEERVKMSRLRQTIATRLKEAQNTAALLTTFNDVDMTAVIEARARYKDLFEKKHGIRLGF
ncbi:MAG: biotin/lipoyl-containing protein, partial [Sphingomicrobium sp.]